MLKKILLFVIVPIALYFIGVATINATNYQVDSSINTDYYSTVHFNQNGNDFNGLFLRDGDIDVTTGEVISFSGVQKTCFKQIKGYYYNSQRGARWRPLDPQSLNSLQGLNGSYDGLDLVGGLRRSCSGEDAWNVYGQVTHTYKGNTLKLLAGIDYDLVNGKYLNSYSGSFEYENIQNMFSANGYIYDTLGGIAKITSNIVLSEGNASLTGIVSSGTFVDLEDDIIVVSSGYNGQIDLSNTNFIVSGGTWDGIIIPPTIVTGTEAASAGEQGIPTSGTLLFTVQVGGSGTSLVASGGYFYISLYAADTEVGETLNLYRSQDGDIWEMNTPDASCIIDSSYMCNFRTDHLSFFSVINPPIITTVVETSAHSNGGNTLLKDDCSKNSKLLGANKKGKDYSPSYYDGTCLLEKTATEKDKVSHKSAIDPICTQYTNELNNAYIFARKNNITTVDLCENANVKGELIRSHMAKMMVNFVENVLKKEIELSNNPNCLLFDDINNESNEMKGYISKACSMGLMGLDSDGVSTQSSFNPTDVVSRAQLGTVLSRVLRGSKNNIVDSGLPYHAEHLLSLKNSGIMNKIDSPYSKELRGWVMLMMQRLYESS